MTPWRKILGLLLLLLAAQQGAVVHELNHWPGSQGAELKSERGSIDGTCALCPVFAQAVAAALGHSFQIPALLRDVRESISEPPRVGLSAATPLPQSRGPPA
jgi:hypothetical protein